MINKKNSYHNLLLIASVLLAAIPPALVSGPFLPDFFIVVISIIFLFIYKFDKDFLYRSLFFKLFILFILSIDFFILILLTKYNNYSPVNLLNTFFILISSAELNNFNNFIMK